MDDSILKKEEKFHDDWAKDIDPKDVDVDSLGLICTLPEIKYIISELGDLKGKKILDIGCGWGEASVLFAKRGADVTASDLSGQMLELTSKVAKLHGVEVSIHKSSSTGINLPDESFDIVYMANLLHHVDIESTTTEVYRVLKPGGIFVSWDPVKYNPIINIYRRIATQVRTEDEHPLSIGDVKRIEAKFGEIKTNFFWLFTLLIFIKFYFLEKVHPNAERYWKKMVSDHKKIESLYLALEKIDNFLLKFIPPLRWMCWNIVIFATKK